MSKYKKLMVWVLNKAVENIKFVNKDELVIFNTDGSIIGIYWENGSWNLCASCGVHWINHK